MNASLELRAVGDLSGRFVVPAYQRGYRWGRHEVDHLLRDIWEGARSQVYCLQPVVVKRRPEGDWELVDGQQRLTTLFLAFRYMERERLQNAPPPYTLRYETRARSEAYLLDPRPEGRDENIDFFHIHGAYARIDAWFEDHGPRRQYAANKLYEHLYDRVKVIWYEAPADVDATALFTRLNVGRIPLTDAELVKALLLSQVGAGAVARPVEVAAQWDAVERDLRDRDLWAFATNARPEDHPTRIGLLLDLLAGATSEAKRAPFFTFEALRPSIEADREGFWRGVLGLHATLREWFEDRDLHHKIGYLIAEGTALASLVAEAKGKTRRAFRAALDEKIRQAVGLTRAEAEALRYDTPAGYAKCARLLHLMNVETVRRLGDGATERYPFRIHKAQRWSLEHVHAQHAEGMKTKAQWQAWLAAHHAALAGMPPGVRPDELVARVAAAIPAVTGEAFEALAREVLDVLTPPGGDGEGSAQAVHSIGNLALLPADANSALGNAAFEVKRRRILELDRRGEYIPICTRRVFLKYYTGADAQQMHFWSPQDRAAWLDAMFGEDGALRDYLTPEVSS